MSRKFKIPARMVRTLRMGLHGELGDAASEVQRVTEEPRATEHPERYEEPLARLDGARALLDEVGWGERPQTVGVEIDLARHKCPLLRSLRTKALVHRDMIEEAELVNMERAKLGKGRQGAGHDRTHRGAVRVAGESRAGAQRCRGRGPTLARRCGYGRRVGATLAGPQKTPRAEGGRQFVGRFRVLTVINSVGRTNRSTAPDLQPRVEWSAAAHAVAEAAVLRIVRCRYPGRHIVAHWNEPDAAREVSAPRLNLDRRQDAA